MRSFVVGFTCGVYPVPKMFDDRRSLRQFPHGGRQVVHRRAQFPFRTTTGPRRRTWDPQEFADDIRWFSACDDSAGRLRGFFKQRIVAIDEITYVRSVDLMTRESGLRRDFRPSGEAAAEGIALLLQAPIHERPVHVREFGVPFRRRLMPRRRWQILSMLIAGVGRRVPDRDDRRTTPMSLLGRTASPVR